MSLDRGSTRLIQKFQIGSFSLSLIGLLISFTSAVANILSSELCGSSLRDLVFKDIVSFGNVLLGMGDDV